MVGPGSPGRIPPCGGSRIGSDRDPPTDRRDPGLRRPGVARGRNAGRGSRRRTRRRGAGLSKPQARGRLPPATRVPKRAAGDILVFIDSDVEIQPDALSRIRHAFRDDPGLTAVFGSYDDSPPDKSVGSQFRNLLHHHVHQEGAGPATTFWAGLGAIRRDAFLEAGGFDANRYSGATMKDIELGMRISAAGGRIVLDPWLRGTHLKRWPIAGMVGTDFWRRGTPWVRLLLRRGELSSALNLGWRHRLSALLSLYLAWTVARWRPARATAALTGFLGLNHRFHVLLIRRARKRTAVLGVPLHLLHHLTAVGTVASGCALELIGLFRRGRGRLRMHGMRVAHRPQPLPSPFRRRQAVNATIDYQPKRRSIAS